MARHRWRYKGGRDDERNECRRCNLLIGHDWTERADGMLGGVYRVFWLARRIDALREPWPRRKPLPKCVEVKS